MGIDSEEVALTHEFIERGQSDAGGWNREQILALGLKWPLRHGWKADAVGKVVTADQARRFLSLRGQTIQKQREDAGTAGSHPKCRYCKSLARRLNELIEAVEHHLELTGQESHHALALFEAVRSAQTGPLPRVPPPGYPDA